ncbi:MAG: methionyl-tRNA formyltransferase [Candidatus Azobacteroides sp.]|nr:methionyl-tRNA formyltransferase [Candidatus Azobacteroides sp.]
MTKEELRIIFMGTPEFATESLKALSENGYNVVGVVTMPDKPSGRGHKLQPSAVKEYAMSRNLPVLQPEKLKSPDFLKQLADLNPDLQIVVAFRMLPEVVWNLPPKGTFNLHGSLLPQYRGAAPINWAVINGEKETGVTTFFLSHEIDTGEIIFTEKISVSETDTFGTVHDKLMKTGADLVLKTVDAILEDKVTPLSQEKYYRDENELKPAPKIFKETCKINWNGNVEHIYNFVRGLSPYPTAWTELQTPAGEKIPVKVIETEKIIRKHDYPCGTLKTDGKTFLDVAVSEGFIRLKNIQLPGKKRMNTDECLRGFKITENFKITG